MLGVQDEFVHQGTVAELYERCGMDARSLENAILEMKETN
jgi:deoxyxylulose-5-phosphate synthase